MKTVETKIENGFSLTRDIYTYSFDNEHSTNWNIATHRKEEWFIDMGTHPKSPFIPHYNSGCCQNLSGIICPYCGCKQDIYNVETGTSEMLDCDLCELEFRVESKFAYGYSTYPKSCKNGHHYVFSRQYYHEGKCTRTVDCLICGYETYTDLKRTPLPWLDEYNNLNYFDPEGLLDTGRDLDEIIEDRLRGPGTPVLDFLQNVKKKQEDNKRYGLNVDVWEGLDVAIEKHKQINPESWTYI